MRKLVIIFVTLFSAALLASVPWAENVTSASNVAKGGGTIYVDTWLDGASLSCAASSSSMDAATEDTSLLTCKNTGDIIVRDYDQVQVELGYQLSGGSAVVMQCDTSQRASGAYWAPVPSEDSTGAKSIRSWTWTTSADGIMPSNFNINAYRLRCRAWITGGTPACAVRFNLRLVRNGG